MTGVDHRWWGALVSSARNDTHPMFQYVSFKTSMLGLLGFKSNAKGQLSRTLRIKGHFNLYMAWGQQPEHRPNSCAINEALNPVQLFNFWAQPSHM
jgi:hypothetical protein